MSTASTPVENAPYILVVDDDQMQRLTFAAMLRRAGFEVDTAVDGPTALQSVHERRPDAVIIDAVMPILSGFETIERLRAQPEFETLPTIVVSGLEDVDSRVQALSIGADDFITKPVHADELVARLRAQLRQATAWSNSSRPDRPDREWLDQVIADRAFDVHFQPVVDMRTGRATAYEALVRFHDGTPPSRVFNDHTSDARQTDLELLIVETACEIVRPLPSDVLLHVNVTPAAARADRLATVVADAGRAIVLEITEHELFSPDDAATLRDRLPPSCRLAADDVGAGFSGLTQLVSVRPEIVKIDREIISCVHDDPVRQVVVAGLVRFAAATGAKLIAEGIERRNEAAMLIELGVHLGQGYYFGHPAPLVFESAEEGERTLSIVRPCA